MGTGHGGHRDGGMDKGRSRYLLRRGRASEGERKMDGKILGGSVHTTFYETVKEYILNAQN